MDKDEVLVHIAAPSGYRDDKRYHAQAGAVARFEAATITRIYGGNEAVGQATGESRTGGISVSFSTSLDGENDVVKETPVQPRYQHLLSNIDDLPPPSAPDGASSAHGRAPESLVANQQNPCPAPNPPYQNALLSHWFEQSTIQAVRTPGSARPKTAPSSEPAIRANSPVARWSARKRARSKSSSFESTWSVVPETQQVHNAIALVNSSGSSTRYMSSFDCSQEQIAVLMKHSRGVDEEAAVQKRIRLDDTSILGGNTAIEPSTSGQDQPQPYFLRDRSLDWTPSPTPVSSDTTETTCTSTATATPSQRRPQLPPRRSSSQSSFTTKEQHAYQDPTSPINLISQDLYSTPPERLPPISAPPAPPSSPPVLTCNLKSPLSSLSTHIFPPPPPTGHGFYTTHVTPVLSATVNRLPITKWFRPVHVARDVRVLERGHWHIPITIASQAVVDEARSPMPRDPKLAKMIRLCDAPTSKEHSEGGQAARTNGRQRGLRSSPVEYGKDSELLERKRQDFWTGEEFVEFWGMLEECIGDGKWGWGVRVFREELTVVAGSETGTPPGHRTSSSPPGELCGTDRGEERHVILKVTTWGEVIPHIWILLWLMSDKLTAYIPMEWRAGDDQVVVRMSGHRRKHGTLGRWVYKGPAGEKATWGIAEADELENRGMVDGLAR